MKKRVWILLLAALTLSLVFSLAACDLLGLGGNNSSGQAPVYKGMTVSKSPNGGAGTFIYAETYESVYVTISLDNPDDLAITSVTINDKTYEAASFESGSTRKQIVIRVNVSNNTGIVPFTVKSIQYADGKVLKDVAITDNNVVYVGVYVENQVSAFVTKEVGFTEITLNITVMDDDGLIAFSNGGVKVELYCEGNIVEGRELAVGNNAVTFSDLDMGQWYLFQVVGSYDNLQEGGKSDYTLYNDVFKTNEVVSFANVTETYDGVEFDLRWREDAVDKTVKELHVLDGDKDVVLSDATATTVTGLLSNRDYTVVVYFDYNGQTYSIRRSFHTLTKHAPSFSCSNLWVTEDEIRFDVRIDDPDRAGTLITTLDGQNVSALTGNQKQIKFSNLTFGKTYEIEISYDYDLNDGEGSHPINESYTVTVDSQTIHKTSCKLRYNALDYETCIVYQNANCTHQVLAIPSVIDGYTVTRMDRFSNNYLTTLILPDTVTQFATSAFANCKNLTSVTLPQNLSVLGEKMFSGCEALSDVTIPTAVTAIPNEAFYGCKALTSLAIPSNVVTIGNKAFSGTDLQTLTFVQGGNLTTIGDEAFYDLNKITELTLPDGVKTIGAGAFYGLKQLTALTIPASVERIGDDAFSNWTALQNLTFEEGSQLRSIGNSAFYRCEQLTQLNLPSELYSIGDRAFAGINIATLTIPRSVVYIKAYAFVSNSVYGGLQELIFENDSGLMEIGDEAFSWTRISRVAIPRSVMTLGANAFRKCTYLSQVEFGANSNLQTIGGGAFAECTSLTRLTIPASVRSIGASVFEQSDLTTITFESDSKLTTIGSRAFFGVRLSSINIPASVTSIGSYAFSECKYLTAVNIPASVTTIGERAFYDSAVRTVTLDVDGNLKTIGAYAFAERELTTITIPRGVTTIGEGAFQGCALIKDVVIPSSVTTIGEGAFKNCSGLQTFTFSEGSQLTTIGAHFFDGCSSMTQVTIPASVTSIGEGAFQGLVNLRSVTFEEDSKLQSIGYEAFKGCSSLPNIILPEGLTQIYGGVFYGCTGLQWVIVPTTVTYIGGYSINYDSTKIYYSGSYEQWGKVSFGDSSDRINLQEKCVNVYFKSYPQGHPTWRYDDNGNPTPNV